MIAFSSSAGSTRPVSSTGRMVRRKPWSSSQRQTSSTAGCSTAEVMMWLPRSRLAKGHTPNGKLLLSVPPLVKITSAGLQPSRQLPARGRLNRQLRRSAKGMAAGRVAETVVEIGGHCLATSRAMGVVAL